MQMIDRPARGAVVAVVVAVMSLAACSSSSKPSSSSPTTTTIEAGGTSGATSDTCKAVNDFKAALTSIGKQTTLSEGKAGAQAAVDSAQQALDTLKSDLKSADKPK